MTHELVLFDAVVAEDFDGARNELLNVPFCEFLIADIFRLPMVNLEFQQALRSLLIFHGVAWIARSTDGSDIMRPTPLDLCPSESCVLGQQPGGPRLGVYPGHDLRSIGSRALNLRKRHGWANFALFGSIYDM